MKLWQKIIAPVIVVEAAFTVIITWIVLRSVQETILARGEQPIDLIAQVRGLIEPLILIGTAGLLVLLFIMHTLLITRFQKLAQNLRLIGEKQDLTIRIPQQNDEIGDLATAINHMLDRLATSIELERESNKKVVESAENLKKSNDELERINGMMVDRELKMIQLKKEKEMLEEQLAAKGFSRVEK